jgi:hypothetical protein
MIQEEVSFEIKPVNYKCSNIINKDYVQPNPNSSNAIVENTLTTNNNQASANAQYDNVSNMDIKPLYGGYNKQKLPKRHFKLVSLNGHIVNFDANSYISNGKSPSSAAQKILTSIAHHKNLFGKDKIKLGLVSFVIRETTRGSKTKEYGPYKGQFKKYTPSEMKKASYKIKTTGKNIVKTMKPVIYLNSKKK